MCSIVKYCFIKEKDKHLSLILITLNIFLFNVPSVVLSVCILEDNLYQHNRK